MIDTVSILHWVILYLFVFPFRLGLDARHYKAPESHTHVARLVKTYASEVKEMNKDVICRLLKDGFRFSVTLDEYTRLGNRKLFVVNLHIPDGDFLRIGMIRIRGSMPAEVAKEILTKKLAEYGIELKKHVICNTVDGASVCVKLGKLLKILQQICLAHGLHLSVCDVLYKAKRSNENEDKDTEGEDDIDKDNECGEDWLAVESDTEPELIITFAAVIEKVRKIVRKFRRSTVANDTLQEQVEKILGKEKMLRIDVK